MTNGRTNTLSKLATLAHNRAFTRRDWSEYGGSDNEWRWLRANDYIDRVDGKAREWYPTTAGWALIDEECNR